ncbi:MAG: prolyl oligopeptidase family serine peptidase [Chitinophagaceae bacterium]|jgi:predicted peptidase|nr:prolyl oligopeptidase family serine peptidase [Chitinophagaceae bacterium]
MKTASTLFLFLLLAAGAQGQDKNLYEKQLFILGEDTLRCRILTPLGFSPTRKYPLVVFLHGAGERGNDNESQLLWGSDFFTDSLNRIRYPAIIVFPQCPANDYWASIIRTEVKDSTGGFSFDTASQARKSLGLVFHFIDTLLANGGIDPQRIYIGGLSMGGFGTFEALWRRPDLFAAAFPICGGGSPEKARNYASSLPVWVFHGDADPVVPVSLSRNMVQALKGAGAKVKYTEYPGVGHDSWNNALREKDLMPWIFSQKKTVRPKKR